MRLRAVAPGLALALAACPRPARVRTEPCATLGAPACERARALVLAALTYQDEQHDLILAAARGLPEGSGIRWAPQGWKQVPAACALASPGAPAPSDGPVDYAFVGVAIDGTLVAADADLSPLLGAPPEKHDVRLLAIALQAEPPRAWNAGPSLVVKAADDSCTCEGATHFAGSVRHGATLAYAMTAPRDATHVRAVDFVSAALGDARFTVREANDGLVIDGLSSLLDGRAHPLAFRVTSPSPVAMDAAPLDDVCTFAAPEVTPSPLDFGVAPYGASATRDVHVVNRAPIDLEAIVGARTIPLPAHATIDLALRWAPDGDAQRCETQTRDESILFLPAWRDRSGDAGAPVGRRARVLETIRTGKPRVERRERFDADRADRADRGSRDEGEHAHEWSCPRDFKVAACRAENAVCGDRRACTTGGYAAVAEPRGQEGCRFDCREPAGPGTFCRFEAAMECVLACP